MFKKYNARKEATEQIINELLAEEFPVLYSFNPKWVTEDVRIRDGVIWYILDDNLDQNNKVYDDSKLANISRRCWLISQDEKDKNNIESAAMWVTIAAAIMWVSSSDNKATLDYLDQAKELGNTSLATTISGALKSNVPGQIFIDSVTMLQIDDCLGKDKDKEEEKEEVKKTAIPYSEIKIQYPEDAVKFLWNNVGSEESGFIEIDRLTDSIVQHYRGTQKEVNEVLEEFESLTSFICTYTFNSSIESKDFSDSECWVADCFYIDVRNGRWRSLMCDDFTCCPEEGREIV